MLSSAAAMIHNRCYVVVGYAPCDIFACIFALRNRNCSSASFEFEIRIFPIPISFCCQKEFFFMCCNCIFYNFQHCLIEFFGWFIHMLGTVMCEVINVRSNSPHQIHHFSEPKLVFNLLLLSNFSSLSYYF